MAKTTGKFDIPMRGFEPPEPNGYGLATVFIFTLVLFAVLAVLASLGLQTVR